MNVGILNMPSCAEIILMTVRIEPSFVLSMFLFHFLVLFLVFVFYLCFLMGSIFYRRVKHAYIHLGVD